MGRERSLGKYSQVLRAPTVFHMNERMSIGASCKESWYDRDKILNLSELGSARKRVLVTSRTQVHYKMSVSRRNNASSNVRSFVTFSDKVNVATAFRVIIFDSCTAAHAGCF